MKEVVFLDGKIQISIPEELKKLSEQEMKEQQIDGIVQSAFSSDTGVMISVHFADKSTDSLEEMLQKTYYTISTFTPGFQGFGAAKREQNGILLGVIQYKSNMIVKELYNSMMICYVEDRMVIISAHCDWAEFNTWKDVFFEVYESINISK